MRVYAYKFFIFWLHKDRFLPTRVSKQFEKRASAPK